MYAVEVFVGRKFGRYARHQATHQTKDEAEAVIQKTEAGEVRAEATVMLRRVVPV